MQVVIQLTQNRPTGTPNIPQPSHRDASTECPAYHSVPAGRHLCSPPRGMQNVTTRPSGTVYWYYPAHYETFASHNHLPNIPAGTPNIPTCPTGLPYICSTNPTIRPIKTLSTQQPDTQYYDPSQQDSIFVTAEYPAGRHLYNTTRLTGTLSFYHGQHLHPTIHPPSFCRQIPTSTHLTNHPGRS